MKSNFNYIGSKHKLIPFLSEAILDDEIKKEVFCDLFAGTSTVGSFFKNYFKNVISNDSEYYSYVISKHLIENTACVYHKTAVEKLNDCQSQNGFIFETYSENGKCNRLYFSEKNGKKIDGIRLQIEEIKNSDLSLYFSCLFSLLSAADRVANTTSVYEAYLKNIKPQAGKNIVLEYVPPVPGSGKSFNMDAEEVIEKVSGNVLYMDPPYNQRRYGSNYHILNTISKYDNPEIKGKTGMRCDVAKSKWNNKRDVAQSLDKIVKIADFENIFLSYNSDGLLPQDQIVSILKKYGNVKIKTLDYKAFASKSNQKSNVLEFLFCLKKK